MSFAPTASFGNTYLPTTRNFEQEDAEQLKLVLNDMYNDIANSVNLKENGIFETIQTQSGQQFFGSTGTQQKKRYVFRKSFVVGPIAAGATGTIAHSISGITLTTHISGGVLTAVPDFRPLPHASVTANANIEVIVGATNISINNGAGGPNITSGIVVLEFLLT